MIKSMKVIIDGMGFVVYSPFAVKKIPTGEDFLTKGLWSPEDVKKQVESCQIIPFCTGSPGDYTINCYEGLPSQDYLKKFEFTLQLRIIVRNDTVCLRDLFDFMRWDPICPDAQMINIPSGYYVMTIVTSTPESGITGESQTIEMHFHKIGYFPIIKSTGVPLLCEA